MLGRKRGFNEKSTWLTDDIVINLVLNSSDPVRRQQKPLNFPSWLFMSCQSWCLIDYRANTHGKGLLSTHVQWFLPGTLFLTAMHSILKSSLDCSQQKRVPSPLTKDTCPFLWIRDDICWKRDDKWEKRTWAAMESPGFNSQKGRSKPSVMD